MASRLEQSLSAIVERAYKVYDDGEWAEVSVLIREICWLLQAATRYRDALERIEGATHDSTGMFPNEINECAKGALADSW